MESSMSTIKQKVMSLYELASSLNKLNDPDSDKLAIRLIEKNLQERIADIEKDIDELPESNKKKVEKIRKWLAEMKRKMRLGDSEQGEGSNFGKGPGKNGGGWSK